MEHALIRAMTLKSGPPAIASFASTMQALCLCAAVAGTAIIALPAGDAVARTKSSTTALGCAVRTANGTGVTEKIAKFQVYEGVLKATDTGLWLSWMATGTTPGFAVKGLKYRCGNDSGLGVTCRGHAKVCKV